MKKNSFNGRYTGYHPCCFTGGRFQCQRLCIGGVNTDKSEFSPHVKYGGGKYDESFALDAESRVGIQVRAGITDKLSATAQVVSRGGYNWRPEITWAYLGYEVNDNVQLKLGRLKAPFYLYSDYQDVGYALPWISPPRNAYIVPIDAIDGLNITTNFSTGKFDHVIEAWVGHIDDAQNKYESGQLGTEIDAFGFSYAPSYDGWLTLRYTYNEGDLDLYSDDLNTLNDALTYFNSNFLGSIDPKMIGDTASKSQRGSFSGLALKADFDKLTIVAELNQLEWHTTVFPHQKRGYISAIYRATDKFTPYITLMKNNDSAGDFQLATAPADVLNTALQIGFGASDTTAWAIGGRYDLMPNVALKAEYQSQSSDVTKDLRNEDVADTIRVAVDVLF